MDNLDRNLELIQKIIQVNKPELMDADLLTQSIMTEIKSQSLPHKNIFLVWVRTISGIAAIFLLGLFLYQHPIPKDSPDNIEYSTLLINVVYNDCEYPDKQYLNVQKLMEVYACHLKRTVRANKKYQLMKQNNLNE